MHPLEALLVVVLTLVVERGVNVPRDIRRNNERIRNRDEDLATWIEDDHKQIQSEFNRLSVTPHPKGREYLLAWQYQRLKDEVLHRYRDQLRDAERIVRDVVLSEQLPHRLVRRAAKQPVPELTTPTQQASTLAEWNKRAEDDFNFALHRLGRKFAEGQSQPKSVSRDVSRTAEY